MPRCENSTIAGIVVIDGQSKPIWVTEIGWFTKTTGEPGEVLITESDQAKFLVRGGQFENPEGSSRSRNVVLEFKDYATALACYNSPEYQHAITLRAPHAVADIVIVEGYDGVQPGDS